jgi:hypothetical protein
VNVGEEIQKKPEFSCRICSAALNEDELILNERFVAVAMQKGYDASIYPICIECNYTSMITGQRSVRASVNP